MEIVIPVFLIAFFITFSVIPVIISYSRKKQLLDNPGGRKIHKERIPALGGIGIGVGFIVTMLLFLTAEQIETIKYFIIGILAIAFLGIRDDLIPMGPYYKLAGQLLIAVVVVIYGEIRLTSLHGLFSIHQIPDWLSIVVSIFTVVVITNAFNLIDGLDCLAGFIGTLALVAFVSWYYLINNVIFCVLIVSLLASILAFLKYNYSPAKIFMGDTGALLIGFVVSLIAIRFIELNFSLPDSHPYKLQNGITVAVTFIIYPLYDTLRIFTLRIIKKRSPFSPDKSHVHHLIMRMGTPHVKTSAIISFFSFCIIIVAVLLKDFSDTVSLPIILFICFLLGLLLDFRLSVVFDKKTPKKQFFK
jgi:UDP-N-acetylmuramyl pentapeptide phosphotransferase/UDP-N-acetylglucosamine-1-phosphate transferase